MTESKEVLMVPVSPQTVAFLRAWLGEHPGRIEDLAGVILDHTVVASNNLVQRLDVLWERKAEEC